MCPIVGRGRYIPGVRGAVMGRGGYKMGLETKLESGLGPGFVCIQNDCWINLSGTLLRNLFKRLLIIETVSEVIISK